MPRKPVEQLLRAPDRERGDEHVALVAPCIVEDAAQLADGLGAIAMVAIAIG